MGKGTESAEPTDGATPGVESTESLIEVALGGEGDFMDQHDAVMSLWSVTGQEFPVAEQELAVWGLGEIAKEAPNKGIGSLALDRLDRIAKEDRYSRETKKLASDAIRAVLK